MIHPLLVLLASVTLAASAPSPGYTAAKAQWKAAPCQAAAVQGRYWLRAARDLSRQPARAGSAKASRELKSLASLPDTSETPAQMKKFGSDARALNRFFHTPGNLIGRHLYCKLPG